MMSLKAILFIHKLSKPKNLCAIFSLNQFKRLFSIRENQTQRFSQNEWKSLAHPIISSSSQSKIYLSQAQARPNVIY